MTYAGLLGAVDADAPHLGGNVIEGDPFTHSPLVWDYLIQRFALRSVLDELLGLKDLSNDLLDLAQASAIDNVTAMAISKTDLRLRMAFSYFCASLAARTIGAGTVLR